MSVAVTYRWYLIFHRIGWWCNGDVTHGLEEDRVGREICSISVSFFVYLYLLNKHLTSPLTFAIRTFVECPFSLRSIQIDQSNGPTSLSLPTKTVDDDKNTRLVLHNLRERTERQQMMSSVNKRKEMPVVYLSFYWFFFVSNQRTKKRCFPQAVEFEALFAMIVAKFWWMRFKFVLQPSSFSFKDSQCCLVKVRWAVLSIDTFRAKWLILHRIIFVRTAEKKTFAVVKKWNVEMFFFTFDDKRFDVIGWNLHSFFNRFKSHFSLIFRDLKKRQETHLR